MTDSQPMSRPEVVRVEEIMIPIDRYPSIAQGASIREAMRVLETCGQIEAGGRLSLPRTLLVFDEEGRFVGAVRRRDLLRGIEPQFLKGEPLSYRKKLFDVRIDPNLSELSFDHMLKEMCKQAAKPVATVMRPIDVALEHDDHLFKAVYEMVSYGLALIPVLRGREVVGVVRTVDVFAAISRMMFGDCPKAEGDGGCRDV
jgi:predicted transcriptional regulator